MDLFAFIIWYLHFYVSRVEQMSYQYTMRRELTLVNHMISDEKCNSVFASNCKTVCITMWYTSFKWQGQTVYITIWDTKDGYIQHRVNVPCILGEIIKVWNQSAWWQVKILQLHDILYEPYVKLTFDTMHPCTTFDFVNH